jgi:hypothetical protein
VARKLQWTSRMTGGLIVALAVAAPVIGILEGCGGGGSVRSPSRGSGQSLIPSSQEFLALLPEGQQGAHAVGTAECGRCHGPGTASTRQLSDIHTGFAATTHARVGVSCESCHGPGSAHAAANGDKSKILTFPTVLSAAVCSQCHATVHQEWVLSKHDDKVDGAIQSGLRGGPCLRCHSAQFRVEVIEKGRPAGDLQRFAREAHTASCAVCHDPHRRTGNLSDDKKEVQLRHAVFSNEVAQVGPGTTPDQHTTLNQICAQCHNGRGTDPSDAALERGTARPSMHDSNQYNMLAGFGGVDEGSPIRSQAHFNAPGQCSTCHMFDGLGRHTFTVKLDNCSPCHTQSDAAARRNAIRGDTESRLLALRNRMERWATNAHGDKDLWDYTALIQEEGKTPPDQTQVPIQIKRARHNYYFVLRDASLGTHNGTYTRNLMDVANRNLDEIGVASGAGIAGNPFQRRAILEADRRRASRADAHGWGP